MSFSDNNLAMAYLPVTICKFVSRVCVSVSVWFVQTFFFWAMQAPSTVDKPRIRRVTSKSCQIVWKRTKPSWFNPVKFEVHMQEKGPEDAPWSIVSVTDISKAIISDLNSDTEYRFKVKAKNKRGESNFGTTVETRTLRLPSIGMGSTGPMANGKSYTWEQTLKEVTLRFHLPKDMSTKQLEVEYNVDSLFLRHKTTGEVLLGGKLRNTINPDACVWSKDPDSDEILVELEKKFPLMESPYHWSCVFEGHPKVDCSVSSDGDKNNIPNDYLEEALFDAGESNFDYGSS